jgi:DNA-binding response OmpR family regulator
MKRPSIAIVVDTDASELQATESALEAAGFAVIGVDSFQRAKTLLQAFPPGVVIAAVKLGAFNGLHLATLCSVAHPGIPFVVTNDVYDPVLDAEARQVGAAYVVTTSTREELTRLSLKLVDSAHRSRVGTRQWPRKNAPDSTFAKVAASEAKILDVSYSGVRLRVDAPRPLQEQPPEAFDIDLPQLSLSLRASRVWTAPDPAIPGWFCGADLTQNDPNELGRWRDFVDSLN